MNFDQIQSLLKEYPISEATAPGLKRFGNGHIHGTFLVQAGTKKFILQQFNSTVFKSPETIASNQSQVAREAHFEALSFEVPLPIATRSGKLLFEADGKYFRLFDFVDGKSVDYPESETQAKEAAKGFGGFAAAMNNINPEDLNDTIPDFHRLDLRFQQFFEGIPGKELSEEEKLLVDYYAEQKSIIEKYSNIIKRLPIRITHNDTKLNNLIFSKDLLHLKAVIDLDTLMPGFLMYDFGDLVRTAASGVDENNEDWDSIGLQIGLFQSLAEGYLEGFGEEITKEEIESLHWAGEFMTLMMGLRFLTDHLDGNKYYHVHHPLANLVRTKNQMLLLESLKAHRLEIREIFSKLLSDKN